MGLYRFEGVRQKYNSTYHSNQAKPEAILLEAEKDKSKVATINRKRDELIV